MTTYKTGDQCPRCNGTGTTWLHEDAHRSGGYIPCSFSTSITKWMGPRGAIYGKHHQRAKKIRCVGLTCNRGKLG